MTPAPDPNSHVARLISDTVRIETGRIEGSLLAIRDVAGMRGASANAAVDLAAWNALGTRREVAA